MQKYIRRRVRVIGGIISRYEVKTLHLPAALPLSYCMDGIAQGLQYDTKRLQKKLQLSRKKCQWTN